MHLFLIRKAHFALRRVDVHVHLPRIHPKRQDEPGLVPSGQVRPVAFVEGVHDRGVLHPAAVHEQILGRLRVCRLQRARAEPLQEPAAPVPSRTLDTAAMLGRASPRKPMDWMVERSASVRILLVAWRWNASGASSGVMPCPSSVTRIARRPACSTSTDTRVAPASMAFSTSSFTTEAGRSTT